MGFQAGLTPVQTMMSPVHQPAANHLMDISSDQSACDKAMRIAVASDVGTGIRVEARLLEMHMAGSECAECLCNKKRPSRPSWAGRGSAYGSKLLAANSACPGRSCWFLLDAKASRIMFAWQIPSQLYLRIALGQMSFGCYAS